MATGSGRMSGIYDDTPILRDSGARAEPKGGLSPRAHSDKTPSKPRYRFTPTLSDPRTATRMVATARSFRVRPSAWICVDLTRSKMAGIAMQRPAGARRKRLAQNHHSGGQPVRAAGHWRDHGGQPDHRDGLCRPCRPPTTRPGQAPCFANHQPQCLLRRRICHQQAFAGPQHLVGWR